LITLLLNDLDFSDPLLLPLLETDNICNIIKRSGKRLQYFHIWYHTCQLTLTKHISDWSMAEITNNMISIGPSLSLQRFRVSGHQNTTQDEVITEIISKLRPKIFELVTCACRAISKYDEAAQKVSAASLLKYNNNNSGGDDENDNNGESKRNNDNNNKMVEFRSRIAQYGTFQCVRCEDRSNIIGWYRLCMKCSKQYCTECSFEWDWSNELLPDPSKKWCSCSYCVHRDRLILQHYGRGSSSSDNDASAVVVVVVNENGVAAGLSLQNDMNSTNINCDNVNNNKSSTIPSSCTAIDVAAGMIIPSRYSGVHCRKCPEKKPARL
jgi:hypothetical protein